MFEDSGAIGTFATDCSELWAYWQHYTFDHPQQVPPEVPRDLARAKMTVPIPVPDPEMFERAREAERAALVRPQLGEVGAIVPRLGVLRVARQARLALALGALLVVAPRAPQRLDAPRRTGALVLRVGEVGRYVEDALEPAFK